MHLLAAQLAALALLAASPALAAGAPAAAAASPAASGTPLMSAYVRGHCARPRYDGHQGVTALIDGAAAPTNAVVVTPERAPRAAPAVLWVHWLGEPATTNHTEFLADAQALAKHGVVSLLIDMPWSRATGSPRAARPKPTSPTPRPRS